MRIVTSSDVAGNSGVTDQVTMNFVPRVALLGLELHYLLLANENLLLVDTPSPRLKHSILLFLLLIHVSTLGNGFRQNNRLRLLFRRDSLRRSRRCLQLLGGRGLGRSLLTPLPMHPPIDDFRNYSFPVGYRFGDDDSSITMMTLTITLLPLLGNRRLSCCCITGVHFSFFVGNSSSSATTTPRLHRLSDETTGSITLAFLLLLGFRKRTTPAPTSLVCSIALILSIHYRRVIAARLHNFSATNEMLILHGHKGENFRPLLR